jgi:hypothetical protein
MERRSLVNGGLAAGMAALVAPPRAEAGAGAAGGGDADTTNAVHGLQNTVQRLFDVANREPWAGLERIRRAQHDWLKSQQKYPDFLEVGLNVWDSLHDWHVRYQQPMSITRLDDGRYAMAFMFTTILLRSDLSADWIGHPFDLERRRQ